MVAYKCFFCGHDISPEYIRKKVRCPYCGSKVLFKQRMVQKTVKAV
ncbi:MAG: DNA-directed RNA polymerase subunit P [Candidatus Woesearchaeota archaeon]